MRRGARKGRTLRLGLALVAAGGLAAAALPTGAASAEAADPHVVSGGMSGVVPARDVHAAGRGGGGGTSLLSYHNGPIMLSSVVQPIFWGTSWQSYKGDEITGMDGFYGGLGGTSYMGTNTEYTDGNGNRVGSGVSAHASVIDNKAAPKSAPSTSAVLAEVASVYPTPAPNAYYPVYSDQPRGSAGYCAWHSTGTVNGVRVQFGFFFKLDGDGGCDPQSTYGGSEGLQALANVSGHEISEMVTDPQLNAWYDRRGYENADKCAWTFSGKSVVIGGTNWKIQGNFSNNAYNANTGYVRGCIDGT